MSTKISSNNLFHFTKNIESVMGIISEGFRAGYCEENFKLTQEGYYNFFVPMISFCDIPLSRVHDHINKYGGYGIGMNKEWTIRNQLNPVTYISVGSYLAETLQQVVLEARNVEIDGDLEPNSRAKIPLNILRFVKNYEADLVRGEVTTENYRFYDEREWRFVPEWSSDFKPYMPPREWWERDENKAYSQVAFEKYKGELAKLRLALELKDINYIILEKESDRLKMIEYLNDNFADNSQIEIVKSKLLTKEQIENDF
ncbi:abortive infection system antitoxin AbiGi family protein [Pseudoalteromonas byunsanensis]|uniref:Abortive phage resistance protein n=1 Tax=Pseudoalteromonas byunsanensis TaxID=327939 RepID=A0A1S1N963_9GAMM|nr:abortive infection system antitoxin AbiGi family protein [Pseudoalteromonas byunsanensis]OHU95904.1 hypothetical protein BIW53_08800 [Pseudoalteromonas byunsanensis]